MSDMQRNTEMLAREAQLVFSNAQGWSMSDGSLRTWRGKIENVDFEIFLPRLFPEVPPVVRALKQMSHPNIDTDGRVSLRILENWRVEYHIYQVILQLTSLLKRNKESIRPVTSRPQTGFQNQPSQPSSQPSRPIFPASKRSPLPTSSSSRASESSLPVSGEIAVLRKELDRLKEEVTKRDEQLTHVRAKEAIGVTSGGSAYQHTKTGDQIANLEAEQIAISELMANLDERHETGEISTLEYSKLFKKYSRDLFILNKKNEFVQKKQ